jgi:starvation-inducible DNA-binding protein
MSSLSTWAIDGTEHAGQEAHRHGAGHACTTGEDRKNMTTRQPSQHTGPKNSASKEATQEAQPKLNQRSRIIQTPDTVRMMPIALPSATRLQNAQALNQILIDTIVLYNMYKKHHWQVSGHTFYQLHLLFDKHAAEQLELVDLLAERVQLLGGVAIGMPHDVAERTTIERAPLGVEEVPAMIDRLLNAHQRILQEARELADKSDANHDQGTNDLLVSDVIRTNELQVWFIAEHVVDSPAVDANPNGTGQNGAR